MDDVKFEIDDEKKTVIMIINNCECSDIEKAKQEILEEIGEHKYKHSIVINTNNDLKNELADYAHKSWSGWMRYLFSKCRNEMEGFEIDSTLVMNRKTGNLIIPREFVERWKRQIETDYKDLPENEKESDLKEADKMIKIFRGNS